MVNVQTLHRRAARVLPEVIKTSGVLLGDTAEHELTALLFPLRRKSSGALMFRLSAETIEAMGDQPLVYLKEAMRARDGIGRRTMPFVYKEWREARIEDLSRGEGLRFFFAVKTDGKALLILVPAERVAIYLWRD